MMTRLLPIVMAVGSAGVVAKGGGEVAAQVMDTIKVIMTRSELSQFARLIEADAVLGHRPPRSDAALASYLRENVSARSSRDVTLDQWGEPYRVGRDGRALVLLSLGPNRVRDRCAAAEGAAAADNAQRAVTRELAGEAHRAAPSEDDVCVRLVLGGGRKGGSGDPLGSDSPFRPISDRERR